MRKILEEKMMLNHPLFLFFKVGVDGLTYAGCHGLKIIHPDGQRYIHHVEQVSSCFLPDMSVLRQGRAKFSSGGGGKNILFA
jgi:hypothetical protein